jgi:hypothetical protein
MNKIGNQDKENEASNNEHMLPDLEQSNRQHNSPLRWAALRRRVSIVSLGTEGELTEPCVLFKWRIDFCLIYVQEYGGT